MTAKFDANSKLVLTPKYNPLELEMQVRAFWEKNQIPKKIAETRKLNSKKQLGYVEGPPTMNGIPHVGHARGRVIKDFHYRLKTMQNYYVSFWAGWDTQGLPVEIEVEKELGLSDKQEVENYGISDFNKECKKCVFKYENVWVDMTKRIGFWLDMNDPYITLENDYIESVWWSL